MTTLVTGGTGFLGRHLVEKLIAHGEQVRVFARSFDLELADRGVELIEGSLTDPQDVRRATEGVTRVYHLAGHVERNPKRAHLMYDLHVEGTRHLLDALRDQKVDKIVYASTSGTVGVSKEADFIADESSPTTEQVVKHWPYYLSKIYAERVVQRFVDKHELPIVTMRPTLLLGPGDRKQSSTGDVLRFLQKKIPATVEGGISFVDVRDVADAFILAMDQGKPGESYLLGACNLTTEQFFQRLADLSGVRAPWLPLPERAMTLGTKLFGRAMKAIGKEPALDAVSVEMAQHYWYIDSTKALRELGWTPRNANTTLQDTIDWLRAYHPELMPDNVGKLPPEEFIPAVTLEYVRKQRAE